MTELAWTLTPRAGDSRREARMPITSIVAAESSIVIAAPLFLLRWLVVVAAVTAWILLVPVVETARGLLSPLAAR